MSQSDGLSGSEFGGGTLKPGWLEGIQRIRERDDENAMEALTPSERFQFRLERFQFRLERFEFRLKRLDLIAKRMGI